MDLLFETPCVLKQNYNLFLYLEERLFIFFLNKIDYENQTSVAGADARSAFRLL